MCRQYHHRKGQSNRYRDGHLPRLVEWVKTQFNIDCCRQTICKSLKKLGLSWKKALSSTQ
ncbi:winged helix-turn-helix domain-containing protein [Anabaena cylindrica]|uniref:winged helix-turn-helix domain-containing protein n=1 Tax=Anabaena cylindrica TaxID=1165 RepID=UPI003A4DFF18